MYLPECLSPQKVWLCSVITAEVVRVWDRRQSSSQVTNQWIVHRLCQCIRELYNQYIQIRKSFCLVKLTPVFIFLSLWRWAILFTITEQLLNIPLTTWYHEQEVTLVHFWWAIAIVFLLVSAYSLTPAHSSHLPLSWKGCIALWQLFVSFLPPKPWYSCSWCFLIGPLPSSFYFLTTSSLYSIPSSHRHCLVFILHPGCSFPLNLPFQLHLAVTKSEGASAVTLPEHHVTSLNPHVYWPS